MNKLGLTYREDYVAHSGWCFCQSDPYLRVINSGIVTARTMVINNSLDPEWDEIVYVPIHNIKERFVLETMDYEVRVYSSHLKTGLQCL
jgi:Ca2+-dependent lipid-binding protein